MEALSVDISIHSVEVYPWKILQRAERDRSRAFILLVSLKKQSRSKKLTEKKMMTKEWMTGNEKKEVSKEPKQCQVQCRAEEIPDGILTLSGSQGQHFLAFLHCRKVGCRSQTLPVQGKLFQVSELLIATLITQHFKPWSKDFMLFCFVCDFSSDATSREHFSWAVLTLLLLLCCTASSMLFYVSAVHIFLSCYDYMNHSYKNLVGK